MSFVSHEGSARPMTASTVFKLSLSTIHPLLWPKLCSTCRTALLLTKLNPCNRVRASACWGESARICSAKPPTTIPDESRSIPAADPEKGDHEASIFSFSFFCSGGFQLVVPGLLWLSNVESYREKSSHSVLSICSIALQLSVLFQDATPRGGGYGLSRLLVAPVLQQQGRSSGADFDWG